MNFSQIPLQHPSFRLNNYILHIRLSVNFREWPTKNGVLYYFCSFSDEIDDRFKNYISRLTHKLKKDRLLNALIQSTLHLELTDSIICKEHEQIIVIRGSSANFPLYHSEEGVISTMLTITENPQISISGLASYMTADLTNGINEPNAVLTTPFLSWKRFRRSALTILDRTRGVQEIPFPIITEEAETEVTMEHSVKAVQEAFTSFISSQKFVKRSVLELSGGFDSTLAGTAVLPNQESMYGISAVYPYYEFKYEESLQKLVADSMKINRTLIDGTVLFPYSKVTKHPWLDEPSKFMTGAKFTESIGEFASSVNATKIYVGHGGDDLFDTDTNDLRLIDAQLDKSFFTKRAYQIITSVINKMIRPEWRHNNTGLFTYDGRLDTWVKETFSVSIRSPFSDLSVFRAAQIWSAYCRSKKIVVNKSILTTAFPEMLPIGLRQRKGKTRYEGIWARAYYHHGSSIADAVENCAEIFETIGILPGKIINRVKQLQNYKSNNEAHIIASFAIADWLLSHNLRKKRDIRWQA